MYGRSVGHLRRGGRSPTPWTPTTAGPPKSSATAMDKLPRTVEVNSQIAELGKHMGR